MGIKIKIQQETSFHSLTGQYASVSTLLLHSLPLSLQLVSQSNVHETEERAVRRKCNGEVSALGWMRLRG